MKELKIFEKLKTAYECSTPNSNLFVLCFITPSLNPFDCDKFSKPSIMLAGGSYIEF